MKQANHVRIDRVTQGPDGQEKKADRLSVDSDDFLWLYVEAVLPGGAAPQGEYSTIIKGKPDPTTRQLLGAPDLMKGWYRFRVIHGYLSKQSKYLFHFADNLGAPKFEDQWEIWTV